MPFETRTNFRSSGRGSEGDPALASSKPRKWLPFKSADSSNAGPSEPRRPEFRVFVLGTRGSGKTVLLSAIQQRLSVQSEEIGFYLEVPSDRDRIFLTQQYDQIADPNQPWPMGTTHDEVKEFAFQCAHSTGRGTLPLFAFTYIDYPGGLLTDLPEDEEMSLVPSDEAKAADAVIALLDGQNVLHHLRGDRRSTSLDRDLRYLLPCLAGLDWRTVHFVVTKWDILEQEYSFDAVRDALLDNGKFRDFVAQRRRAEKPIHLIPVSAVGGNFAMLDDRQVMRKRPGSKYAEPYLVEMTITMTLTDVFLHLSKSLESRMRHEPVNTGNLRQIPIFLGRLLISLFQGVTAVAPLAMPFGLKAAYANMVLAALDRKLEDHGQRLKHEAEAAYRRIADRRSALEAVVMKQAALRFEFEKSFPRSDLTRS